MELDQLWQTTLSEIELQISRPNFLTWFKNSRLIEKKKDGEMIIGLANNFSKEWVRNKACAISLRLRPKQSFGLSYASGLNRILGSPTDFQSFWEPHVLMSGVTTKSFWSILPV